MAQYLDSCLDWSMAGARKKITWDVCASLNPLEWSYEDLEIFYILVQADHLALALHRYVRPSVLAGLFVSHASLPVHTFIVDAGGYAMDVKGRRRVEDVLAEFQSRDPLHLLTFSEESQYRAAVPAIFHEDDIGRAAALIPWRYPSFGSEYRRLCSEAEKRRQEIIDFERLKLLGDSRGV